MFFDDNDQKRRNRNPNEFAFSNLKLIQSVPIQRSLDFLETFQILKNKHQNLMNKDDDDGPVESPFFVILINDQSNHT
jgi:hypothetical protein